jgi:hypothetical protein
MPMQVTQTTDTEANANDHLPTDSSLPVERGAAQDAVKCVAIVVRDQMTSGVVGRLRSKFKREKLYMILTVGGELFEIFLRANGRNTETVAKREQIVTRPEQLQRRMPKDTVVAQTSRRIRTGRNVRVEFRLDVHDAVLT